MTYTNQVPYFDAPGAKMPENLQLFNNASELAVWNRYIAGGASKKMKKTRKVKRHFK